MFGTNEDPAGRRPLVVVGAGVIAGLLLGILIAVSFPAWGAGRTEGERIAAAVEDLAREARRTAAHQRELVRAIREASRVCARNR